MMSVVMPGPQLSRDTQAVLLLCGRFAPREEVSPLDVREYNRVDELLQQRSLGPSALLDGSVSEVDWHSTGLDADRVSGLMARAMGLALATERWTNAGIWVISRHDDEYPARLRQHLGRSAPPLLWGVGDHRLPSEGGVAIVGSREVGEAASAWASDVATACARDEVTVISGGARGTDLIATAAALSAGGRVVAVLPEGLGKPSVAARYREAILDGRLLLLSPFYPDTGFTVGNAMSRNRVIYGLAEAAVIVRADVHSGGTWAGAEQELKREDAIPVFVRAEGDLAEGNRALVALGARQLPPLPWSNVRDALRTKADITTESQKTLW